MTPDGKTFDPETVTDKQLVQYEQAIDRGPKISMELLIVR